MASGKRDMAGCNPTQDSKAETVRVSFEVRRKNVAPLDACYPVGSGGAGSLSAFRRTHDVEIFHTAT